MDVTLSMPYRCTALRSSAVGGADVLWIEAPRRTAAPDARAQLADIATALGANLRTPPVARRQPYR
ncbi:MAG TPA: hypothetical protein VNE00_12995 [Paraburkholderia sp.]|nr:hypothetical protein [Paraburkholderia sp.]